MRNFETASSHDNDPSPDGSMSDAPEFSAAQPERPIDHTVEQQIKLARALFQNDPSQLAKDAQPLSTDEQASLFHYMNQPQGKQDILNRAALTISRIASPARTKGIDAVFANSSSDFERHFTAFTLRLPTSPDALAQITADNLQTLLDTAPTPLHLDFYKQDYLDQLEANPDVSPDDLKAYEAGIENFERKIYGKRYEYAKAYHALEDQAAAYLATENARLAALDAAQPHSPASPDASPSRLDRTAAETDPLADSESYWSPEMKGETYAAPASPSAEKPRKKGLFGRLFGKN